MVGGAERRVSGEPILFLKLWVVKIVHAGAAGNGQVAKIANNMLLGISMIATCEAFDACGEAGTWCANLLSIFLQNALLGKIGL